MTYSPLSTEIYQTYTNFEIEQYNHKKRIIYFNFLLELYSHLYYIIVFEIIFYFRFITHIEKNRITHILHTFSNFLETEIDKSKNIYKQKTFAKDSCDHLESEYILKRNNQIELSGFHLIYICSFIFIFSFLIHYIIYKDLRWILKTNIKVLCNMICIFIFEIVFFYTMIIKYIVITNDEAVCILMSNINHNI